ncbi:hypothetical protein JTE90_013031 [Oedothorax gibbosus]|uniref:GBD/FH3 domain-containing protein n=1 Tax=Oedothorax gibbosus TaxID=931172 RepID=A0AAV6UAE4_9ARAC|nr:hypothetical protein JTE90_013031 [Oedothorax gibbosus]
MVLVAKDYVHYLRRYIKVVADGKDLDGVIKPGDADLKETPKCSQLLASLRDDLRCATAVFLEDFIGSGGVECLLEVLRVCQARQNDTKGPKGRQEQTILRKISSNQYDCLLCLKHVMQNPKSVVRVTDDAHGLSSICSCFMSTYPKSRILALQLLIRVLELSGRGHALILEALTAIRVLFGEPVRFKFLVGLLQGAIASPPAFQSNALKFLNLLLKTSPRAADRIRLQCELEEAGLDINALEIELRNRCIPCTDSVWSEIEVWRKSYLSMEKVTGGKQNLETENERLQKEVQLLRQAMKKLEEDKINLMKIEIDLKEKCNDLNEEVTTLKNEIKKPKAVAELNQVNLNLLDINSLSFEDEDEAFLSGDSGQLGTEEIFIDVPTIRPPIGFRSDSYEDTNKYSPNLSTKSNFSSNSSSSIIPKKDCFQTKTTTSSTSTGFGSKTSNSSDKESADSALSESESDSGINWSYPDIPEPAPDVRISRISSRITKDGTTIIPLVYPSMNSNRKISQRSRSEDRRETNEARNRKQMNGETKVDSTNFFLVRRPDLDSRLSSPVSSNGSSEGRVSTNPSGRSTAIIPSYQLPVAYKNNFLNKGHSTCDLYSGVTVNKGINPAIPPPDYGCSISVANSGGTMSALVHREITKAVKQISGWI